MSKQELLDLKQEIEDAKQDKAKDEGRLEGLMERLQSEFGLNNLDEATKEIEKLEKEVDTLNKKFTKGFEKLKEDYQW